MNQVRTFSHLHLPFPSSRTPLKVDQDVCPSLTIAGSKKGSTNNQLIEEQLTRFVEKMREQGICTRERPAYMLIDCPSTRMQYSLLRWCARNFLNIFGVPANGTHNNQPLDQDHAVNQLISGESVGIRAPSCCTLALQHFITKV